MYHQKCLFKALGLMPPPEIYRKYLSLSVFHECDEPHDYDISFVWFCYSECLAADPIPLSLGTCVTSKSLV